VWPFGQILLQPCSTSRPAAWNGHARCCRVARAAPIQWSLWKADAETALASCHGEEGLRHRAVCLEKAADDGPARERQATGTSPQQVTAELLGCGHALDREGRAGPESERLARFEVAAPASANGVLPPCWTEDVPFNFGAPQPLTLHRQVMGCIPERTDIWGRSG